MNTSVEDNNIKMFKFFRRTISELSDAIVGVHAQLLDFDLVEFLGTSFDSSFGLVAFSNITDT